MDYTKHLLNKEGVTLKKYEVFSKIFEMLSNQQSIHNICSKAFSTIKPLEGDVVLVQALGNRSFDMVAYFGNEAELETKVREQTQLYKQLRKEDKPLFGNPEEDGYFLALPITSKDRFLGTLIIYEEQTITCWEEIYTLLHLMSFVFKYYLMAEENKNHVIQDSLTGLFNYRHFQDQLQLELEKSVRYYVPLTLVVIDIQDFHMINEKLGFEVGDRVLQDVAKIISKSSRKIDMPSRIKGDTFAILLSNTPEKGAYVLLRRLLLSFTRLRFQANKKEFKVKIKSSVTPFDVQLNGNEFLEKGIDSLKVQTLDDIEDVFKK
ncbi:GGDEF domain-containing protein (plasmid) [Pontibacillus sp. ALD_SL1]|uniref:GGDEF domain-containing protein n=1 Tax=Pontibacillus sp. ALD_SL1 TaxID=2777185 RepID=UPI001A95B92A|nr:GGDEF domain-containing protein [Pontibacillus sp. ALD_SL1]QST02999.1 GGDEF domain-containing protein [Pontibacillus sp. ALD_SL1]